jgi:hypothetical protein
MKISTRNPCEAQLKQPKAPESLIAKQLPVPVKVENGLFRGN